MCSDAKEIGMRGSIADSYQDHNRAQMLAAIVKLELVCNWNPKHWEVVNDMQYEC